MPLEDGTADFDVPAPKSGVPSSSGAPDIRRRVHLWRAGRGWIIYMAGEFRVLPDLEGLATLQQAVLTPYANVSSVTGPYHGAADLSAGEAAATGVTYTYDSNEKGKARLAAIARQYQPLIAELEREIASADRAGDAVASDAAHAALRQLKRLMASDLKKEKDSQQTSLLLGVRAETKRLLRAIDAVEAAFPRVGAHLRKRVARGFEVTYEPLPNEQIDWVGSPPPVASDGVA